MVQLSGLAAYKSLEFGPGSPQKASTTRFYLRFAEFYVKPIFLAWSVILLAQYSLNRLGLQLHVDRP